MTAIDEMTALKYSRPLRDENARLRAALDAVLANIRYETPAGTINCRFCDNNMDHEGTFRDMHDKDCIVHTIVRALAGKETEAR